jgi:hypothetical protein
MDSDMYGVIANRIEEIQEKSTLPQNAIIAKENEHLHQRF